MDITHITDDTFIINNFLENDKQILRDIIDNTKWNKMTIGNKSLNRLGSFEGLNYYINDEKIMPWLRCPSIENQDINNINKGVAQIRQYIIEKYNVDVNLAKIQRYDDNTININSHSDKILDLAENMPIFIARFGESRLCKLTHKISGDIKEFYLPHNSLFVLGWKDNLEWRHEIPHDDNNKGISWSIVLHKTLTYRCGDYVFGERTPFKTYEDLLSYRRKRIIFPENYSFMSKEEQKKEIVKCFALENKEIVSLDIYNKIMYKSIYPF